MEIDSYSFQCGVIDCFNEMVAAGVKSLALSRPASREERDALIDFAHESCRRYGTKLYPEDQPLITDLFPLSLNQGKSIGWVKRYTVPTRQDSGRMISC